MRLSATRFPAMGNPPTTQGTVTWRLRVGVVLENAMLTAPLSLVVATRAFWGTTPSIAMIPSSTFSSSMITPAPMHRVRETMATMLKKITDIATRTGCN